MKGKWKGFYTYDLPERCKTARHKRVFFDIEIINLNNDDFRGNVKDDRASGGTSGIGYIIGKVINEKIMFVKKMPVLTFSDREGNIYIDQTQEHTPIYYEGNFVEGSRNRITGNWKFKKEWHWFFRCIPIYMSSGNGEFEMIRVDE